MIGESVANKKMSIPTIPSRAPESLKKSSSQKPKNFSPKKTTHTNTPSPTTHPALPMALAGVFGASFWNVQSSFSKVVAVRGRVFAFSWGVLNLIAPSFSQFPLVMESYRIFSANYNFGDANAPE